MKEITKYINKINDKEIGTVATLITALVTLVAFVLRGYWYAHRLGYFYAMNIDSSFLEMDSTLSLYKVLGYILVAGVLVFLNYLSGKNVYLKNFSAVRFLIIFETIFLFLELFFAVDMNVVDIYNDIQENRNAANYVEEFLNSLWLALLVNVAGLYLGHSMRKNGITSIKEVKNKSENILKPLLFIFVITIIHTFFVGMNEANSTTEYKIVKEIVDNEKVKSNGFESELYYFENTKDNYFYTLNAIIYESDDCYLLANIYEKEKDIYINNEIQRVINKEGVVTKKIDFNQWNNTDEEEEKVIENLTNVEENNLVENSTNEKEKGIKMWDSAITLLAAAIGSLLATWGTRKIEEKKREEEKRDLARHAASLLYNDLKSIERYLRFEKERVNMRYTNDWQNMIANCSFLDNENVNYLYLIYDEVYNYNEKFSQQEGDFVKEELTAYVKLRKLFGKVNKKNKFRYCAKYEKLIEQLKKYMEQK